MDFLLIWFVLAVVLGIVAAAAGRSGFGYFLLSLVLSPLIGFLVLVVMLLAGKPAAASAPADDRPRMACPQCAELVLPQAVKCPHCGFAVAEHVQREAQARAEERRRQQRERQALNEKRGERTAARIRGWLGLD